MSVAAGVASSVVVFAGPETFVVAGSSGVEVTPPSGEGVSAGVATVLAAGETASGEAVAPPQRLAAGTTGSGLAGFAASGEGVPHVDAGVASAVGFGASTGTPHEVAGADAVGVAAGVSEPTADNPPRPDVSGVAGVVVDATTGVVSGVADAAGAASGFLAREGKTLCNQGVFSCVGAGATATPPAGCSGLLLLSIQHLDYSI